MQTMAVLLTHIHHTQTNKSLAKREQSPPDLWHFFLFILVGTIHNVQRGSTLHDDTTRACVRCCRLVSFPDLSQSAIIIPSKCSVWLTSRLTLVRCWTGTLGSSYSLEPIKSRHSEIMWRLSAGACNRYPMLHALLCIICNFV